MTDSTDDETSRHRVASVDDVTEGDPSVVEADGNHLALFFVDGEYFALDNTCPHQGGPLGDGRVDDRCVHCPWHGWQFDIETGEHVHGDDVVPTYDVVVEDGDVHVLL